MDDVRLIDANILKERISRWKDILHTNECTITGSATNFGLSAALSSVDEAITIDPETLRPESEWELNPGRITCEHFRCKKCHFVNCVATKYCGECGAKMKNAGVKPEELPLPSVNLECDEAKLKSKRTSGDGLDWSEVRE